MIQGAKDLDDRLFCQLVEFAASRLASITGS